MKKNVLKSFIQRAVGISAVSMGLMLAMGLNVAAATEAEPNGTSETATVIQVNTKVTGNISEKDDIDWYKFKIDKPGTISFTFSHEDCADPYGDQWETRLYADPEEKVNYFDWSWNGGDAKKETRGAFNVSAGTYFLKVNKYSDWISDEYGIQINYTEAGADEEKEDNGTVSKANEIKINQEYKGRISLKYDIDWYKFTIDKPGKLSITFSHEDCADPYGDQWETRLYADPEEKVNYFDLSWNGGDAKKETRGAFNVPSGTYYLKVNKYSDWISDEYEIQINYTEAGADEEKEDNGTVSKANEIEINKEYKGRLNFSDEIDWYKFTVVEPGKLSITFSHEDCENPYGDQWQTRLYADLEEKINYFDWTWDGGNAKKGTTCAYTVPSGTYYLKVNKYSDWISDEYGITVNYTSAIGTNMEQENNDTVDTANVIETNKDYRGIINFEKELDWYTFTLDKPSDVSVVLSHDVIDNSATFWNVRIFGDTEMKDKYMDLHWAGNKDKQTSETTPRLTEGKYYVLIDKSNKWSTNEYTFSVNATPVALDCDWIKHGEKYYWYEGGVRQGTLSDAKGVMGTDPATGEATNRGREICDNNIKDANGNGTWFWLDSVYDGAKATGKEVWMPYIYQNEADWSDEDIERIAAESDYGMEGMGRCVRDAIKNKSGKWVRYDNDGKMLKGWVEIKGDLATAYPDQKGNKYYYDTRTGLMAKGWVKIDGKDYFFDEVTGVLQ